MLRSTQFPEGKPEQSQKNRDVLPFLIMCLFIWIGLGNLLALVSLSLCPFHSLKCLKKTKEAEVPVQTYKPKIFEISSLGAHI